MRGMQLNLTGLSRLPPPCKTSKMASSGIGTIYPGDDITISERPSYMNIGCFSHGIMGWLSRAEYPTAQIFHTNQNAIRQRKALVSVRSRAGLRVFGTLPCALLQRDYYCRPLFPLAHQRVHTGELVRYSSALFSAVCSLFLFFSERPFLA